MSEQVPGGGVELSPSEIAALDVRWSSCWTPGEVAQLLGGLPAPWCVFDAVTSGRIWENAAPGVLATTYQT